MKIGAARSPKCKIAFRCPHFAKAVARLEKKHPGLKQFVAALLDRIQKAPTSSGIVIPNSNGARKERMAGPNISKRDGFRLIFSYHGATGLLVPITLYSKAETANLDGRSIVKLMKGVDLT